eukprot:TRINITY_DN58686_c0_g1_i1.p1 TRINITY_DN58686_c0_g1~~TRINITY_DN58686_c0_g1_i1.p1  ORF type:complete len:476 (-),score=194.89 TRINITY_DN58686_c0_g1_i1:275-1558(-)
MGDKRRKKRDDWSKYEVEQTPDRFPIPLLKSFLFHERTPYQPAKGKRGYRASTYSDAQGVLQPGVFPLDTALAYRVFSFLEYDDVARAAGVCSSWSRFMAHLLQDRSFVRRCAARGLSPVYRGAIWRLWAQRASNEASDQLNPSLDSEMHKKDAEAEDVTASLRLTSLPEASRVVYERMAAAENPLAEEIHRDTNRTLMHHDRYADDTEAIESLERMLRAYAMHDSEVGYCQGMNFIAAFVLMHVPHTRAIHGRSVPHSQQHQQGDDGDEEEKVSSSTNDSSSSSATKTTRQEATAYWFMFTMMQGTRFNLRLLYTQGLPRLVVCKYQFQRLFEWFLPKLASHFERHNISPELFMTEWFMTMFTYRAIPVETSARIWDLFLVDGWKALHRVGLAILSLSQETLLSESFEGMKSKRTLQLLAWLATGC